MNQEYFEKISAIAKKAQEPFQAMIELNVKTIQGLDYIKPEDLANLKKPEDMLEKQIELAVANGHKALDYMQKSFQIVEKAMLSVAAETKKQTKDMGAKK